MFPAGIGGKIGAGKQNPGNRGSGQGSQLRKESFGAFILYVVRRYCWRKITDGT